MGDAEFAKNHLREYLTTLLVDPISDGFWSMNTAAQELCQRNGQMDQVLRVFQNILSGVPKWSDATLGAEVDRIVRVSKCSYLDDLLMGVFISYMKSFASLHYRGASSELKIDFERPSVSKFVHELYNHSSRKLWQAAYLFKTAGVSSEQQARNRQEVSRVIAECLDQVIRSFLPWEAITRKYFADVAPEPEAEEDEEDAPAVAEKSVSFPEEVDAESDAEEEQPRLTLGDASDAIPFKDLGAAMVVEDEVDPMKDIDARVGEQPLVLNL